MRRSDDGGRTFVRLPWTASDARCGESVVAPDFLANETGYLLLEDGRSCAPRTVGGPGRGAPRCQARGPRVGTSRPPTSRSPARARASPSTCPGPPLQDDGCGRVVDTGARRPGSASRTSTSSHPRLGSRSGATACCAPRTAERPGNSRRTGPARSRIRCVDAFTCVATTPSGQSLMRTNDGGVTFTSVSPSSTKLLAATFAAGLRVVAAGEDGVTVVSDDAGTTWAPLGERLRADVHAHQGGVRFAGVRGRAERDARAHERRRSLMGAARRLHVRGRDRRVVRRRLRRLRGRRRRHGAPHREWRCLVADPEHGLLRDAAGGARARIPGRCC